jgi:uncharacterized protein YjbI with pentapeptide repeats
MPKVLTTAAAPWDAERLAGKTFVLAGAFPRYDRLRVEGLIRADGGEVVDEVSAALAYVVVGKMAGKTTLAQKKAEKLNAAGANVRVLSREEFFRLVTPDPDRAEAMLRAGAPAVQRWQTLRRGNPAPVDLAGRDLRGLDLRNFWLFGVSLEGADLRASDLSGLWSLNVPKARLDGARLDKADLKQAAGARLRKAILTDARFVGADLRRADCTAADLRRVKGEKVNAAEAVFARATLTCVVLKEALLSGADFTGADLSKADLRQADLAKAKLAKATLRGADLSKASLAGADLSKADLREATLVEADLTGASVDGADFTGANLVGVKLDGADTSKAKGLAQQAEPVQPGPNLQELDRFAAQTGFVELQAKVRLPDGQLIPLEVTSRRQGQDVTVRTPRSVSWSPLKAKSVSDGLIQAAQPYRHGHLRLDAVKAKGGGGPYAGQKLTRLAVAAWCEAFGRAVPAPDEMRAQVEADRAGAQSALEALLADLRSGPEGVKRWNARSADERRHAGPFGGVDLSGAQLDGIDLGSRHFHAASFEGASLAGANLFGTELRKARLARANLSGAKASFASFSSADLTGADLRNASLWGARFRGTTLREADLRNADASRAKLCGADLTGAQLEGAKLDRAEFDEKTVWPAGFTPPRALHWKGKGADPRSRMPAAPAAAPAAPPAPAPALTLAEFMDRLRGVVDVARLGNALQMLRAERFQLFTQVEQDKLVGVIRSQSSAERVYACKLCADGSFSCGTQNLRVCGGLSGSICKHLLVLIVGLARGGQVDLGRTYQWVRASRTQHPLFDKDEAAAVFLRYKGAEAGEIDWRPTETIPEDYHAF